jgi:hypothetical protein
MDKMAKLMAIMALLFFMADLAPLLAQSSPPPSSPAQDAYPTFTTGVHIFDPALGPSYSYYVENDLSTGGYPYSVELGLTGGIGAAGEFGTQTKIINYLISPEGEALRNRIFLGGNFWFLANALTKTDAVYVFFDQYYKDYIAGTLDSALASMGASAYENSAITSSMTAFNTWYASQQFAEGSYGLITLGQKTRAERTLTYGLNALRYPVGFDFEEFNGVSGGVFQYFKDLYGPDISSVSDIYLWEQFSIYDLAKYFAKKDDELIKSGAFKSLFEIELFRYWFNLEFWFPDVWILFDWARSGRTGLSVPQIVGDISYSTDLAQSTILAGKAQPSRTRQDKEAKDAGSWLLNVNSPKADLAVTFIDFYDKTGTMYRSSGGYSYTSPSGLLSFGADATIKDISFPHLKSDYLSTSLNANASIIPVRSSLQKGSATLTLGTTINDWVLGSNYINQSLAYTHELTLGDFYASAGGLLLGSYWAQYPQLDCTAAAAARLGYSFFNLFSLNVDAVYTRSLGAIWQGSWRAYTGDVLDLLNAGARIDIYIGNAFSLNIGARADLLDRPYSSVEAYLGGGLAF